MLVVMTRAGEMTASKIPRMMRVIRREEKLLQAEVRATVIPHRITLYPLEKIMALVLLITKYVLEPTLMQNVVL